MSKLLTCFLHIQNSVPFICTINETSLAPPSFTQWYNKICRNNRETCSPRKLKHCGAITVALNVPAQHDAAHRSLSCALPQLGSFFFLSTTTYLSFHEVSSGPHHRDNSFQTAFWTPAGIFLETLAVSKFRG